MPKIFFLITLMSLFCLLCGCKDKQKEDVSISLEETKLILRLFENMKKDNYHVILTQSQKLQSSTRNSSYLVSVIEVETLNIEFEKINKALEINDLETAFYLIKELNSKYPLNKEVQANYTKISLLFDLEKLIKDFKAGKIEKISLDPRFETAFPMDYRNIQKSIDKL